jgi:hypothetical protein
MYVCVCMYSMYVMECVQLKKIVEGGPGGGRGFSTCFALHLTVEQLPLLLPIRKRTHPNLVSETCRPDTFLCFPQSLRQMLS